MKQLNNTQHKNKDILFIDFNGVLSYKPFWFSLQDSMHPLNHIHEDIEACLFRDNTDVVKKWMCGVYSSEDIHELLYTNINKSYSKELLWDVFIQDCKNIDISKNIVAYLGKLKRRYHIILMTDNMDCFDRYTISNRNDELKIFNDIVNSYTEKRRKIDSKCFSFYKYIYKYNANNTNCLLIDDSEKNCAAFQKYVLGTSYCTSTENDVISVLKSILCEINYDEER